MVCAKPQGSACDRAPTNGRDEELLRRTRFRCSPMTSIRFPPTANYAFFACWLVAMMCLWGLGAAVDAADRPTMNVVVLYADDWRHDTLGCAGNPVVKTPNLD